MATPESGPPRGTRDLLPQIVERREAVTSSIAETYASFGFRRIETPSIEAIERLAAGQGGENEKLIYRILRRGLAESVEAGTTLSELTDLGLRFDLTVPLTRYYANNHAQLPTPFRALQIGNVWRAERPAKGRYRQFTQCDIDVVGEPSVLAEAELLEATTTALTDLGISAMTVRLNDRRLLSAVAQECAIPEANRAALFVSLDKLDKLGWEAVNRELEERGFDPASLEQLESLVNALVTGFDIDQLCARAADSLSCLDPLVLQDLRSTAAAVQRLASEDPRIRLKIDPTLVRGMGYYTGQIFEISHDGSESSIAGGGRYDQLVGRALGRAVPACGLSIGFDRIVELATVQTPALGIAVVYKDESSDKVLTAARELRRAGHRTALVPRRKALRQQLDSLKAEGYTGFVLFEDGVAGAVRSFEESPRAVAVGPLDEP